MAAIPIRELYRRYRSLVAENQTLNARDRHRVETIEGLKVTNAGLRDRVRHLSLQVQNLQTRKTP